MQTKQYKWTLRKGSRKEICPNCGKKRFVPYVLAADGVTMAGAEFGRCDREQECGYIRYPEGDTPLVVDKPAPVPKPTLHYIGEVRQVGQYNSPLYRYLCRVMGVCDALVAFLDYKVTETPAGDVVWWQIAADGEVRTGKVMKYGENGHRVKYADYAVGWAHKNPQFRDLFVGEELRQCLFGEHLLTARPDDLVAVVESEKTAVFMSRYIPDIVWVATGGAQGIKNAERLQVLQGRRVILIPDEGQYYAWLKVANLYGWHCDNIAAEMMTESGCDIMDIVLNELQLCGLVNLTA